MNIFRGKKLTEEIEGTQIVQVVPCNLEGQKIYLVDTPGFDDSIRTDAEILQEIAAWLNAAYKMSVKLTGIIYLHRILDVRVGGAGVRNIRTFKKLCGDDGLASVVLATTMWSFITDENLGNMRESQLKTEHAFWKKMIEQGSQVFRQDKGRTSALRIVQYLIDKKRPVTLDIQREMVDKKLQLVQTGAGIEVATELERATKYFEKRMTDLQSQLQDALNKRDSEEKKELEELIADLKEQNSKRQKDTEKLMKDTEQLDKEVKERYERELAEMQVQMEMLKESHSHELKLQKLQLQQKWKEEMMRCIVM